MLKEEGDEAGVKAKGKVLTKGKDYIVEDGDIILIKAGLVVFLHLHARVNANCSTGEVVERGGHRQKAVAKFFSRDHDTGKRDCIDEKANALLLGKSSCYILPPLLPPRELACSHSSPSESP